MALTLAECLREARSLQIFNGSDEYKLTNFLRDVSTVLSLTPEQHVATVQSVLANRLQGKALHAIESLLNPTWEQIMRKLREEFGVRKSFINLRNEAMNVRASSLEELHCKLGNILNLMNTKYYLEGSTDILYSPINNETIIFDVYINFLPIFIKTLILQNNIKTIDEAHSYYIEHNLINDIHINTPRNINENRQQEFASHIHYPQQCNSPFYRNNDRNYNNNFMQSNTQQQINNSSYQKTNNNSSQNQFRLRNSPSHYGQPNNNYRYHNNNFRQHTSQLQGEQQYLRNGPSRYGQLNKNFGSHFNNRSNDREQTQRRPEPMEVDTLDVVENFRFRPREPPNYP